MATSHQWKSIRMWIFAAVLTTCCGLLQPCAAASGVGNTAAAKQGAGGVMRPQKARLAETVSVRDFGAVGDGVADDHPAFQSFYDHLASHGGTGIVPPGTYLLKSQATLRIAQPKNILLSGYGATLMTRGPISAIKVTGSFTPHVVSIQGFSVDHRGNTSATAGFELAGTAHASLRDNVVEANGVSNTYAAFWLHNANPADNDTGTFWTLLDHVSVRKRSGTDSGAISYGIKLQGAANATIIRNSSLSTGEKGIAVGLITEAGRSYLPNGVVVDGNAFEGFGTAIDVSASRTSQASGLRITNNRAESGDTFFKLGGSKTQPAVPTFLAGNYLISNVKTYVSNPENLLLNVHDASITPDLNVPPGVVSRKGFMVSGLDSANEALTVQAANNGSGIAITDTDNHALATLHQQSNRASSGAILKGDYQGGRPLGLGAIYGISATDQQSHNLRGVATFSASTSVKVVFPVPEPDANYFILLGPSANKTFWWTERTAAGFTLNASAASHDSIFWMIVR